MVLGLLRSSLKSRALRSSSVLMLLAATVPASFVSLAAIVRPRCLAFGVALVLCVLIAGAPAGAADSAKRSQLATSPDAGAAPQPNDPQQELEALRGAVSKDESDGRAWYALAAALARTQADECGWLRDEALSALSRAIALDSSMKTQALRDPAFRPWRSHAQWKMQIVGLSMPKDADAILKSAGFSSVSRWGASGNFIGIDFLPGHRVVVWTREHGPSEEAIELIRREFPGTWKRVGTTIQLVLEKPLAGRRRYKAVIDPQRPLEFAFEEPLGAQSLGLNGCGDA